MLTRILKGQRGFTLIELLAVIAVMTVLAGIVAGAVTGIASSGQSARLQGDQDTIGKAADRFFNEAFPQSYPVQTCCAIADSTPQDILVAGDLGVRLIGFEAVLPGNPTKSFTPTFLKEIPDTAALVSWRVLTATGQVFFAQDGSQLVRPSGARLDASATATNVSVQSNYTFKARMNKNQAAVEIVGISIPAGYAIGGQGLAANTTVGTLTGAFATDNPWSPGQVLPITGTLKATGVSNEWTLEVLYPDSVNGTGLFIANAGFARADRTHKVSIATPSAEAAGALKIELNTTGDKAQNQATETWELTINGKLGADNIITNPSVKGVYRWLATHHTSIDVPNLFASMSGNQGVVIK